MNGVYLFYAGKYHGKIYQFQSKSNQTQTLIGSSNFSSSGLRSNKECTVQITDNNQEQNITKLY